MSTLNGFLKIYTITSNRLLMDHFVQNGFMKRMSVQRLFCSKALNILSKPISKSVKFPSVLDTIESDSIVSADVTHLRNSNESALDECKEDLSDITPFVQPSYNLASYVNKSPTLKKLVELGVNLHKLEKQDGVPEFLLKLNFDENIKGHLRYLHDVGVPADEFGSYLTKNPYILKEDLEDMQIRINYLQSKQFTKDMITRIVSKNPKWLSFRVVEIDKRLGYFQRTFILSGKEVRDLAVKQPTIITYNLGSIESCTFSVKEEMGFSPEETKQLLLTVPKLFKSSVKHIKSRFTYIHNEMKISHERLLAQPSVLLTREFIIKQRHLFLQSLGRAQYDPKLAGYVSLDKLVKGTDAKFCEDVAKTSINSFNMFLRSL